MILGNYFLTSHAVLDNVEKAPGINIQALSVVIVFVLLDKAENKSDY